MLKSFTKEQRKQIHTIMNVSESLQDEEAVTNFAIEAVATMCNPDYLETEAVFYITTDDEGAIKLEVDVP